MLKSDGLGLSANQVGLPYRVFVMRTGEKPYAVFNPKGVDVSEKELSMK
jgi:peptide deformylase